MDLTRFIQIYIIQGMVCVYCLIIALKILIRNKKRLNIILSAGYFSCGTGFIINFIYPQLTEPLIVLYLYYTTMFFIFIFPVFSLVFVLMLYKSEKVFTRNKQNFVMLSYAILLFCMALIPGGVIINESTDWRPVWSIPFTIYLLLLTSFYGFAPAFYMAFKTMKTFEDKELTKKWKYFLIGFVGIYAFEISILIANSINIQIVRTICSIIGFIAAVISLYLIYYGLGKQLK